MGTFIGRGQELQLLQKEYTAKGAGLVAVYGRRRIGKTRLIEESLQGQKETVYYLAADEKDILQIKELQVLLGTFLHDEVLPGQLFTDWKNLFAYLKKVWPPERKIIMVIDEVTYIIKNNPSFPSYLQQFWDTFLSKTNTCVVLSGSIVGLMLENVLGGKSPLYGRRTAEIHLEELPISQVQKFLHCSLEEAIPFFAIVGGVPKYLELVGGNFATFSFDLFDQRSFFYREGIYLLTEEFNELSTYSLILHALAEGKTKLSEISSHTGLEGKKISAYLDILEHLGFIQALVPVTKAGKKFRGRSYVIADSFLEFWFHFINKHRSQIELGQQDQLFSSLQGEINSFIGRKFEKVCRQFLQDHNLFAFTHLGAEWGKIPAGEKGKDTYEIDLCAINEKNREILFGECKWQHGVNAQEILPRLREKAASVQWFNQQRTEYYVLFAKSFKNKNHNEKNVFFFDLADLEREWKKR